MAKQVINTCDVCGRVLEDDGKNRALSVKDEDDIVHVHFIRWAHRRQTLDLCDKCHIKLCKQALEQATNPQKEEE